MTDRWVSNKNVAKRLGVTTRTIFRWAADENIGFPKPAKIGARRYFSENQIDAWCAARLAGGAVAFEPLPANHAAVMPPLPPRHNTRPVRAADALEIEGELVP
jgi:excisionase family DNA binding protein